MTLSTRKQLLRGIALAAVPLCLLATYWMTNPFAEVLSKRTFSLVDLSPAQRANIRLAAAHLDGRIIMPGKEISFNQVVGPRSGEHGYRQARSYRGPETPLTSGGGICLVSSALYQTALESGMSICERIPHLRTIKSVPPGFDATVWYGQADLRFANDTGAPVRIATATTPLEFKIMLLGSADGRRHQAVVTRLVTACNTNQVAVQVFRRLNGGTKLVSRDLYRLSP